MRGTLLSVDHVRSINELCPNPLRYERTALMRHLRRYEREELRTYYQRQPVKGAEVWANYVVNLWEYEHGIEKLTSYPWKIAIPMTDVCNARCTFCSAPLVPDPQRLKVEEVKTLADGLRYAIEVDLQGLGEPLAHPQFEEIAEEIGKYISPVARVGIITNGWLLCGRRWELLKKIHIDSIHVSVNAATDETHQIAMGSKPGTFEKVLKNIENVFADPNWGVYDRYLKVSCVVTRHSLPEVPQFIKMFVKKGVKAFQINALLPLEQPDWGFGLTDQYLDLWPGHLPNAKALVGKAERVIERYRKKGITFFTSPEHWLDRLDQWRRTELVQVTADRKQIAVFQAAGAKHAAETYDRLSILISGNKIPLLPHVKHTEVGSSDAEGISFQGTSDACRWAYLLRTRSFQLAPGMYSLEAQLSISSGTLYGGILDVEKNDFVRQKELESGWNCIYFSLSESRLVDIIIRQGDNDEPVKAVYQSGSLRSGSEVERAEPEPDGNAEEHASEGCAFPLAAPPLHPVAAETKTVEATIAEATVLVVSPSPESKASPGAPGTGGLSKSGRIFCPMVYSTLSVFQHNLNVSTCCYMEHPPGHAAPNLKDTPVMAAMNDPGFKLVRRTLHGHHLPICETCGYGNFRS